MKKRKNIYICFIIIFVFAIFIYNNSISHSEKESTNDIVIYKDINGNGIIDIGEVVSVGNELFYVLDTNDEITSLISYYNLDLNESKQSDKALGRILNTYNNDVVALSRVDSYLNEYEKILKKDVDVDSVSLVSKEVFDFFKLKVNDFIDDKYSWLYSSSYWVNDNDKYYYVSSSSYYGEYTYSLDEELEYGIRPYVIVDKNKFDSNFNIGDIISIGDEKFYCVGVGDKIKLIGQYNLNLESSRQSSESLGFILKEENYGTVSYSNDEYKGEYKSSYRGSYVEQYVNKYVNYLINNYKVNVVNSYLIDNDILEKLGCSLEDNTCIDAPSWIYKTSYWTSYSSYEDEVMFVSSNGEFNLESTDNKEDYGIRPVVILETNSIKRSS